MKKLVLLVAIILLGLPAAAAVNFYRADNGKIMAEATTCQDVARLADLVGLPGDEDDITTTVSTTTITSTEDLTPTQAGVQTVLQAVLGKDEEAPTRENTSSSVISNDLADTITIDNFNEHQEALLTFVRDVNWKTGLQLTWSDMSIFRRLRMVCTGVNQLTKPVRVNLEAYTGSLDSTIENTSDDAVEALANAARNHSFLHMAKLSLVGLVDALDKENPFLLLALDEETYSKLVEREPNVQTLFEDMYTFFKIRSVLLGTDYNSSIKDLVRVSKIGKGNYFKTWHVLAEYAQKMLVLERQDKLTPQDEKEVHIWRLNSTMEYIREYGRVEKRAAEILAQDPKNASLIEHMQQNNKKKPSLDDKARKLIEKSTQDEIKRLLEKYIVK